MGRMKRLTLLLALALLASGCPIDDGDTAFGDDDDFVPGDDDDLTDDDDGADDDDSSGDDDDSSGDDDDSAGDDDDSAGDDDDSGSDDDDSGDDDDSAPPGAAVGSDCEEDVDCATGVCWDFNDYDPLCFGSVCSIGCGVTQDCFDAFTAAGAPDPGSATCGIDGRCDPVGTGFGAFACASWEDPWWVRRARSTGRPRVVERDP